MTNHTDHMSLLSRELELRSKQKRGREAAIRLRASGLDIPEGSTLFGVVALCHGSDSAPAISSGATPKAILEHLIVLAPHDEDAALAAIVGLRPVILKICRRVTPMKVPSEDEIAEVVTLALEVVTREERHRSLNEVVCEIWKKARTTLRREATMNSRLERLDDGLDRPQASSEDPSDLVTTLLREAVRDEVITQADAETIELSRLGVATISELAANRGLPVKTLFSRRRRAEMELRRHLEAQGFLR